MLNQTLDIAIVLCAVYALLSCLCSWINEQIAAALRLRGKSLYQGVLNLVLGNAAVTEAIFRHPLIASASDDPNGRISARTSIWRGRGVRDYRPSYLDARNFSTAFWQVLHEAPPTAAKDRQGAQADGSRNAAEVARLQTLTVAAPQAAVAALQTTVSQMTAFPDLQKSLLGLIVESSGDYEKLLAATDGWFNAQMDRVSGWYKRRAQWIIAGIALAIVSFSGIDTLEIMRTLSALDPAQLRELSEAAGKYGAHPAAPTFDITQFGHVTPAFWQNWTFASGGRLRASGMLLTLVALTLGGPFWFDALCTLANVRSSGRRPERGDQPPR